VSDTPLVFYDQADVGPVRFELSGDKALARSYVQGTGRAQLGQMKAQSVYDIANDGGLVATGGTGFWHMNQTLPDGTKIQTIHNDGQDTVRIVSPAGTSKTQHEESRMVQQGYGDFLGACGDMSGSDGSDLHAVGLEGRLWLRLSRGTEQRLGRRHLVAGRRRLRLLPERRHH
jgi:hypothetical protein